MISYYLIKANLYIFINNKSSIILIYINNLMLITYVVD
jgi:hypothetical protein